MMKPVRGRTAVIAGVLAALVLGIVFQLVVNSGSSLPRHSWWEAALLLVAGGALGSSGWRIRRYVETLTARRQTQGAVGEDEFAASAPQERSAVTSPSPESARRTLVLAQAAAVGGSVLAGWYAAQVVVNVPRWQVTSVRSTMVLLVVLMGEAVALSVLGFAVQRWCTLPEDRR